MKHILFIAFFLFFCSVVVAQPDNIKRIIAKAKTGQELTEAEEATMEKYFDSLENQYSSKSAPASAIKAGALVKNSDCPPVKTAPPQIAELTRETYIALAKELQTTFGPKSGDLAGLKSLLESAEKPTDGADMGALFAISGAGSASVYVIAASAIREPSDVLTANNLGVALKDMGEYTKALRVLKYADKLKPNIGLIICNLAWVYREMGYNMLAKQQFEKALKAAPEMTSPYLGLGLIAKCEGNMLKAEEYLRKALAEKYSAAGMKAYKQAKAAQPPKQEGNPGSPLTPEKGDAGEVSIPEMPLFDQKEKTVSNKEVVQNYFAGIDRRIQQLLEEYNSTLAVVRRQAEKAMKDPDNSMVFRRDFAKELMMFEDVTLLLFGEKSNYAKAVNSGSALLEQNSKFIEKDLPAMIQHQEKFLRLQQEIIKLMEQITACGDNELCKKPLEERLNQKQYEAEQEVYQMCLLNKGEIDMSYSSATKAYKGAYNALSEAVADYYAFTNPILENIYSPSFNELQNLYRQLFVLTHEKAVLGLGVGLPEMAEQYMELKCVEPVPPEPPSPEPDESKLRVKKEKDCPLGKDGISGGIGVLSFELSCDHVKLSGGEGILWSVKRDFNKHETTIWGGVGVKGEYGKGNVTGEAAVGVEVTIGQGDVIKDVALTSSVKAGLGGLVESEVSGRLAMEGGASVDSNAGFITPEIPDLGDIK